MKQETFTADQIKEIIIKTKKEKDEKEFLEMVRIRQKEAENNKRN